ncbi:mandelate racemase/muconate lactonizing enzyme family protein [Phyllobacterium chamaecytisi]|uniref:mandelate racemase/muconate lactonizing enzyme family protein n=1 Tax=Phyllobacterium chamaecytisi TaxID=2876082 RepID=UPI001CCEE457|nr:mandelate racemase/muconate lactonizing enzyme family protein [Phyllobacterium sp. KW56]MBZ9603301.1 mandelate racemase/muconate lactonizing enzyme family protein [Phyllobacterium sp. KW56]
MMEETTTFADDRALLVERAAVHLFRMPPSVPWEDATHRVPAIEVIVLELTVNGRPAYGFSYTVGVGGTAVRALIQDYCLSQLVGRDARYVIGAWKSLYYHLHRTGMGAITTLALAAIDVALWEVRAQASGRPLHLEMGGSARSIPAYTSGIDLHLSPEELFGLQQVKQAEGYEWFKIKVGLPRQADDIARIAAAREAIGPDAHLVLDANQSWDLGEAVRRCRAFEPFNVSWIEEPLAPEDIGGHATLRSKTGIPLAVGESLYTAQSVRDYLVADAVDIVQADIARVGGLTPWLRIANLAAACNRPVAPHFLVELSLHALCAVDNGLVLENVRGGSLHDLGLAREAIRVVRGAALPSTIAGHGVTLEIAGNQRHRVPASDYVFDDIRSHKE